MKRIFFLLIILWEIAPFAYAQSPSSTTIFIVRHAEKDISDPNNKDPELTLEGQKRANALLAKLKKQKFAAVFSTKYKRTIQTATPIANKSNLTIEYYKPSDHKTLAELIGTKYNGQKVLIVGHSNSVLEVIEAFGLTRPLKSLTEDDYDFLFRIKVDNSGQMSLQTRRYGKSHHTSTIQN